MEIKFTVTKEERKSLVAAVSELTGSEAVYKKAPSFAFVVNNYTIDKTGALIYDEQTGSEDVRRLLAGLAERGFIFEDLINETLTVEDSIEENANGTPDRLAVEGPLEGFTRTALDNLEKLVEGKSTLMMKVFGADSLPVEQTETAIRFPWFPLSATATETEAYSLFVHTLCEMAKKQQRVTLKEADVDSEKFAFRCFLLRLGFIGTKYKDARKILLSNLSGSGAFRSGTHKRSDSREAVTAADNAEEIVDVGIAGEDETVAENAETSGTETADSETSAVGYNPDLSAYDVLMRGGN